MPYTFFGIGHSFLKMLVFCYTAGAQPRQAILLNEVIDLGEIILKLENVTKVYNNGVVANRDITVDFCKGEIHSIVGENGAGKSTLMNMIFGIQSPSEGTITYKGQPVKFASSMDAIKVGIGMVHQHFMLIPDFTVAESIILGSEPKRGIFIDKKKAIAETRELAKKYNFDVDVTQKISKLSVGAKQKVEILKTLYHKAEVIILDEPTSVLTPQETETLFEELIKFRELGHTILFISHKLGEVKQISDRITVVRGGVCCGTYDAANVSIDELTELIIGRQLAESLDSEKKQAEKTGNVLRVDKVDMRTKTKATLDNISFAVKRGEILGIAGVQGNGQEDLIRVITGLNEGRFTGSILLDDVDIAPYSIKKKRKAGLAYIPEDRMANGTAAGASVSDNIISTYFDRPSLNKGPFMDGKAINAEAERLIEQFSIKTKNAKSKINSLSGGNIQKVVVAREYNTNPVFMIADQPTTGIDVGSAEFIHRELIEMRNKGAGILLVSADLDEVMRLSDRILVMFDGKIVAYFSNLKGLSRSDLGYYMLGIKTQTEEELGGAVND